MTNVIDLCFRGKVGAIISRATYMHDLYDKFTDFVSLSEGTVENPKSISPLKWPAVTCLFFMGQYNLFNGVFYMLRSSCGITELYSGSRSGVHGFTGPVSIWAGQHIPVSGEPGT